MARFEDTHPLSELWLAIDPRTGRSVDVSAGSKSEARRVAARRLTELSGGTELDVLAREVYVVRKAAPRAATRLLDSRLAMG